MDQADELMRRKLSDLIGRSGMTHKEVADALTATLGSKARPIRKVDVDEFCRCCPPGESRGKRFPAYLVTALCGVLGNDNLAISLLPDRSRQALLVGELTLESHRKLARALAELEKIVVEAPAGRSSARKPSGRRGNSQPGGK